VEIRKKSASYSYSHEIGTKKERMGIMKELLKQLGSVFLEAAGSKKAIASITGIAVVGLKAIGVNIPEDSVLQIVGLIMAYVVGQGIADVGKESL
jgi:hypothetical protein